MRRKHSLEGSQGSVEEEGAKRMKIDKDAGDNEAGLDHSPSSSSSSSRSPSLNKLERPDASYAALITEAIKASPEGKLLLCDIYAWIETHYPYFQQAGPGWKNSVRHNLSLHRSFCKEPRAVEEASDGDGKRRGRSNWWRLTTPEEQQRMLEEEEQNRRLRRGSKDSTEAEAAAKTASLFPAMMALEGGGHHHRPLLPKLNTSGGAEPPLLPSLYYAQLAATYFDAMNAFAVPASYGGNLGEDQLVMPPPPLQQPTQQLQQQPLPLQHDIFLGALTPTSESSDSSLRRMRRQSSIFWGGSIDDNLMGMSVSRLDSPFWPFARD